MQIHTHAYKGVYHSDVTLFIHLSGGVHERFLIVGSKTWVTQKVVECEIRDVHLLRICRKG